MIQRICDICGVIVTNENRGEWIRATNWFPIDPVANDVEIHIKLEISKRKAGVKHDVDVDVCKECYKKAMLIAFKEFVE